MPVDYETIFKHVQQLNELIADGSEVTFLITETITKIRLIH